MDNKTLEVAVLMATYNGDKYLEEQLNSLFRQKGVHINILVRDDGSTDRTIDILKKYEKEEKLKWFSGKHMDVADSFFMLLENAPESDYYAFCDQDDVWYDDKIITAVQRLQVFSENEYSLYCSGAMLVDEGLNKISEHRLNVKRTQFARLFFANIAGNTMVINKSLRNKIVLYHPQNMIYHDSWVYKVCLCLGGNIILDPEPRLLYRQHGNNVVGMEIGIKRKIRRFINVIKEKKIYGQLLEIKNAYKDEMEPKYLNIIETFIESKTKPLKRVELFLEPKIRFSNIFFDIAFKIKILLGKY